MTPSRSLKWTTFAAMLLCLVGCIGAKSLIYDTVFAFEGKRYLIQEFRFSGQSNTTLFELKDGERTFQGATEGAVIHYTDEEVFLYEDLSLTDQIALSQKNDDPVRARIFSIMKDGEQQGESQLREATALRPLGGDNPGTEQPTQRRKLDEKEGE